MKIKVKVEEKKVLVLDKNDNVLSIWNNEVIESCGGLDKCIERYKKSNPKAEVEVISDVVPAPAEPTPAPAEPTPAPAEPTPAPAEPTPAPAV